MQQFPDDTSPLGESSTEPSESTRKKEPMGDKSMKKMGDIPLWGWLRSRFDRSAAEGLVFAGFWYRLIAFIIDFPLSLIFAVSVMTALMMALPAALFQPFNTIGGNTAGMLLVQAFYFVAFERSAWKSTPGKRLFKLRVTDSRGMRLTWGKAIIRLLSKISIPFTFGGVIVWLFFSPKAQTLYDRLTGTLVLRKTNESFLPAFCPEIVRKNHILVVIALCLCLSFFAIKTTSSVMMPRLDVLTLKMMVSESLKDMASTQRLIEEDIKKNGRAPTQIDASRLSKNLGKQYLYSPANGSISVIFGQGSLAGRGLLLTPTRNGSADEVIWTCAAVNLPQDLAPDHCAPTR